MIEPSELTRVVLLVSTPRPSRDSRPDYEGTITFKSLSHVANNKHANKQYYYWLIHTEQSKETAEFIDSYFANNFNCEDRRLYSISRVDDAQGIFELILEIASLPINTNEKVYCDCTGGTKTMSIAMAMACNHHNLTTNSQTTLNLTFVPPESFNDEITFCEFDLSRVILEEQRGYIQEQNRLGRMQYYARFSPILAHEIKNPLNLIGADLYLLRNETGNNYSQELLEEIGTAVNEIGKIIDSVQQVVRGESDSSLAPEISLGEVIRRIQMRTKGRFPRLDLKVNGRFADVKLRIAKEKLYTIFTNLIDNAANATKETGTVILEIQSYEDKLIIEVRDDGPGIPTRMRPNIFKPMQRGENTTGTGMGLHIVKVFILEEGGTIEYDDSYEQGARFLIELPTHRDEA